MKDNPSIRMIEIVADGLGSMLGEVVFVGGATTGIYIDDPASPEPRPTDDVDCVTEVMSKTDYYQIEEKLRALGFTHVHGAKQPVCRWKYRSITVDVMPSDPAILGFSNRWYQAGIQASEMFTLPSKRAIRVFTVPYFLASKLEAFRGRGGKDFRMSSDLEDIVSVLDGSTEIENQVAGAPNDVRDYLRAEFGQLLKDDRFREGVISHLPRQADSAGRLTRLWSILEQFVAKS